MRKYIILLIVLCIASFVKGQNEVGVYYFPQLTTINNLNNTKTDLYTHVPTFSSGTGINYIHFFNNKYDFRNLRHKFGLRVDVIYSAHNQKFKSEWKAFTGDPLRTHKGKKRLDYLKFAVNLEYSHSVSRHLSYIFYGGPQVSYLVKSDGGIVAWKDRGENNYLYLLPPASNNYYKRITVEAAVGAGFDYELSMWLNLSSSLRVDYSISTIDSPDAVANDYPQFNFDGGRNGSRNMSIAWLMGIEYTLHQPEHAKTRY